MNMNEVFNGLTSFLVSVLVFTRPLGINEPFETVVGLVCLFGIVVAPSSLVAGLVMKWTVN